MIFIIIITLPIIVIEAQTITKNSSNITSSDKNEETTSSLLDNLDTIITIITTLLGISGAIFGYLTHRKNQSLKRLEIIFPLIEEFEKKRNIFYAKELIEGVPIKLEEGEESLKSYEKDQLPYLLIRDDNNHRPLNNDEILIRIIIDSILNFFGKLGYLIDNKLITKREISYFLYYIEKANDDPSVRKYATKLRYELFAVLLDKIGMIGTGEKDLEFKGLSNKYNNRLKQQIQ